jgi:hypothetical protein
VIRAVDPPDLFIGRGAGRHIRDALRQRGQSPVDRVELTPPPGCSIQRSRVD